MSAVRSDALVLFGATGDLAHKQIFPALHAMVRRGHLAVPVIGVAKAGWNDDLLRAYARDGVGQSGTFDASAFDRLAGLLRFVDGDYREAATFDALRAALGAAARPLHYLAIPPSLFLTVVEGLDRSGCAGGSRVVVEKPFGRDLASARALKMPTPVYPYEPLSWGPPEADRIISPAGGWHSPGCSAPGAGSCEGGG
jgi:glucose-6-phosphate 1-dehydrogenase